MQQQQPQQQQPQQQQPQQQQPQHGRRSISREAPPSAGPYQPPATGASAPWGTSMDRVPAAAAAAGPQYGRRADSAGMDGGRAPPPSSSGGSSYAPRGHTSVRMHAPPGGASQISFG
jgi:hypothetical protein